jgi:BlaI family transcriptional regulator, penicillinase repressor
MAAQPPLSRRERQIMEIVYRRGEATVGEILEEIADPPSYSTIRALLRVLVEKDHLRHRAQGPRYVYSPTVSRREARTGALAQVVNVFFDGSAAQAASALLSSAHAKLSKDELDQLSALIEAARKKGR